jgi:hypothetical protein
MVKVLIVTATATVEVVVAVAVAVAVIVAVALLVVTVVVAAVVVAAVVAMLCWGNLKRKPLRSRQPSSIVCHFCASPHFCGSPHFGGLKMWNRVGAKCGIVAWDISIVFLSTFAV